MFLYDSNMNEYSFNHISVIGDKMRKLDMFLVSEDITDKFLKLLAGVG